MFHSVFNYYKYRSLCNVGNITSIVFRSIFTALFEALIASKTDFNESLTSYQIAHNIVTLLVAVYLTINLADPLTNNLATVSDGSDVISFVLSFELDLSLTKSLHVLCFLCPPDLKK